MSLILLTIVSPLHRLRRSFPRWGTLDNRAGSISANKVQLVLPGDGAGFQFIFDLYDRTAPPSPSAPPPRYGMTLTAFRASLRSFETRSRAELRGGFSRDF